MTGAKPFKTPLKRAAEDCQDLPSAKIHRMEADSSPLSSCAPTSSQPSRRSGGPRIGLLRSSPTSSTSSRPTSDRQQLQALQSQVQTLRDAVKWLQTPDEAARLRDLIDQWLSAGREVAERLFAITRKPEEGDANGKQGWSVARPSSFASFPPSGSMFPGLSEEQREWLEKAPRNADGEPCDVEGNPLFPDEEELKLGDIMKEQAAVKVYGNRAALAQ